MVVYTTPASTTGSESESIKFSSSDAPLTYEIAPSHIGKPESSSKTPSLPLSKVTKTLSPSITGLLLPLIVSAGSLDLYDHKISPLD